MSAAAWFYNHRGRLQGPFEAEKIIEKIEANELGPDDLVYQEGEDKWQPLSVIEQFAKAIPKKDKEAAKKARSASQWVVLERVKDKANKQLGPYTTEEMQGMIARGELKLSDYVWRTGMKEWYRVQVFTELVEKSLQASIDVSEVPELPTDLPVNTQTSTMAGSSKADSTNTDAGETESGHEPIQIHYEEITAVEPMPEEAEGPDLAQTKSDPRDKEILEDRVNYRLRPDAIERIRKTVGSGSKAMEFVQNLFSGSGARWIAAGISILLVLFVAGQVLNFAKKKFANSRVEAVRESTPEPRAPEPRANKPKAVRPKAKPAPQAVAAVQVKPSPTPPKPTVEAKRAASYIKISYDSEHGKLKTQTDASSHFATRYEFTSLFGKVLGKNSYYKTLLRKDRNLNLRELNWPRGYYFLEATMGDVSSQATVFVGSGIGYSKELNQFKKRMTLDFMNERIDYIRLSTTLLDRARSFEKILKAADNTRAWQRDYGPWRRSFSKANSRTLRNIGPKSRSRYVMAEMWLELKDTRKKMDQLTRSMSKASQRKSSDSLNEFRVLRRKLTSLVSQAQGLSMWR